ncbi:ricin-type beta-trefoil lectin domain protein [Streptomyces sp. NPDC048191]|uniref:RICIN domain-containing protein n=1 Tax=Streptomyces sp. NPDC048191 TaxID=3155484 RepID=UPI0033F3E6AD
MSRIARTLSLVLIGAVGALACGLSPVRASADSADPCAQFANGCPPFSNPHDPPDLSGHGQLWIIKSAWTTDLAITVNGRSVSLQPNTEQHSQIFRFVKYPSGVYMIQLYRTLAEVQLGTPRLCLKQLGSDRDGPPAVLDQCDEEDNYQYWEVEPNPSGFFWIRRSTGALSCLDADNPMLTAPSPGARLLTWGCHDFGARNQAWAFQSVSDPGLRPRPIH